MAKANRKAATAKVTPATVTVTQVTTAQHKYAGTYKAGKAYNPGGNTQNNNHVVWGAIQQGLQANKGQLTWAQLHDICKGANNGAFAGYAVRRGYVQAAS